MTEKRYIDESEDYNCIIRDNIEKKDYINSQIVDLVNTQEERIKELEKENRGLEFKIIDMLDFIKEKETVTREEIKKWWNGDVE